MEKESQKPKVKITMYNQSKICIDYPEDEDEEYKDEKQTELLNSELQTLMCKKSNYNSKIQDVKIKFTQSVIYQQGQDEEIETQFGQQSEVIQEVVQQSIIINHHHSFKQIKQGVIESTLKIEKAKIYYQINIVEGKKYKIQEHNENNQYNNLDIKIITIQQLINKKKIWEELDKINQEDPKNELTFILYREILNCRSSLADQTKSEDIKRQVLNRSKQVIKSEEYFSPETVLLCLQSYLKSMSSEIHVFFCKESSIQTELSLKIISTGLTFLKFKCQMKISRHHIDVNFESITKNQDAFNEFQRKFHDFIQQECFIDANIRINSIQKLSSQELLVQWATASPRVYMENAYAKKWIKLTPFFTNFYLCINDFSQTGNIKFTKSCDKISTRGNWPYYSPVKCRKYAMKVKGKYDKNDDWMQMSNQANEWPSAFIGLPHCQTSIDKQNIHQTAHPCYEVDVEDISKIRNELRTTPSVNKKGKIGDGIITSPYVWVALKSISPIQIHGRRYYIIFQCRLNPKKIKIAKQNEYWVVNRPCNIRPYGVILMSQEQKQNYPSPTEQFNQVFTYQNYKQQIDKTQLQS